MEICSGDKRNKKTDVTVKMQGAEVVKDSEREGLEVGYETCYDVCFKNCSTSKNTGGQDQSGRVEENKIFVRSDQIGQDFK